MRRTVHLLGLAFSLLLAATAVKAEAVVHRHGIAMHGEPALPRGFAHLPYVNPQAPRGGKVTYGVLGTFGPSRIMKLLMTADRAALFRSLERLLALDFDRVIVGHGRILETGGRERLRASFASRYG